MMSAARSIWRWVIGLVAPSGVVLLVVDIPAPCAVRVRVEHITRVEVEDASVMEDAVLDPSLLFVFVAAG